MVKRLVTQKPENGALPQRRRTENLPGGLYYFEDELETNGVLKARVITAAGWLLEFLKLDAGEISCVSGAEEIAAPFRELAIFYPPFTVTRPVFSSVKARLKGVAGTAPLAPDLPAAARPLVFEVDFENAPKSAAAVAEVLRSARAARSVDACANASLLSLRAKKLIDQNYRIFPSIARIAARLNVSHAHLTRQFKRDLQLSPNAYLHQIRIADATFRLTRGEQIIEVSNEVGYNDLSRFYKQFRKSNAASPGFCRAKEVD